MGKKRSRIILLLIVFIGLSGTFNFSPNFKVTSVIINNELQISDSWNLPYVIVIDNNWSDTRDMYDWCYGFGTELLPYVIENVTINGQNSESCVTIKNSIDYFIIRNCTIYNSGTDDLGAGINLFNVMNGTILNSTIINNGGYGLYIDQSSHNLIKNNTFNENGYGNIRFYEDCNFNNISNNIINGSHFTFIRENDNNIIIKNNLIDSYIYVDNYCDNNTIESNWLYNCNGIRITWNQFNTIKNNTIISGTGIVVTEANHNDIINNTVKYTSYGYRTGYTIDGLNEYNRVINNTFQHNSIGIGLLTRSKNNEIIGNTVIDNDHGIILEITSENNLIYLNVFANDELNAEDSGFNNKWNNSNIGNYWHDYGGIDADDDGIGDIPYNISDAYSEFNSQDFFPIWYTEPEVTLYSPLNNTYWNTEPAINIIASDNTLQYVWYNVNSHREFIESGLPETFRSDIWNSLPEGPFLIEFFANDSINNINDQYKRTLIKDTLLPLLTVETPLNGTIFRNSYPNLTVTVSDTNLDLIWYKLNNLTQIHYFDGNEQVVQSAWDSLPDGNVIITVGVDDKAGNTISKKIVVIKITESEPESQVIDGFLVSFLLLGIFSISIILVKLSKKNLNL